MNNSAISVLLLSAGLPANPKYTAVLGVFAAAAKTHFSVDDIYRAIIPADPSANVVGIYRIVRRLHEASLLRCNPGRLGSYGGKNMFRLAEDALCLE